MQLTPNLNLKKPEGTDVVDINDLNGNADILDAAVAGKVDKVAGKGLSTEDYTTAEKNKLAGVAAGAQVNAVISVAGKTGAVTLAKGDVGLGSVDNVQQAPITHVGAGGTAHAAATTSAAGFMSAADKSKLDGVAAGANNYTHPATHPPSIIAQDASNRFVTDAEKANWNGKVSKAGDTMTGALTINTTANQMSKVIVPDAGYRQMVFESPTKEHIAWTRDASGGKAMEINREPINGFGAKRLFMVATDGQTYFNNHIILNTSDIVMDPGSKIYHAAINYGQGGDLIDGAPNYGLGRSTVILPQDPGVHGAISLAGYFGLRLRTAGNTLDIHQHPMDGPLFRGKEMAVVESYGSNANGDYFRFANGFMICTARINIGVNDGGASYVNRDSSYTWTYPVGFVTEPNVNVTGDVGFWSRPTNVESVNDYGSFMISKANGFSGVTNINCTARYWFRIYQGYLTLNFTAIGRWK